MCDLSIERFIARHFAALEDPRSATQSRHKLIEVIIIAIAATLSRADGWTGVETFAKAKKAWLLTFLELPHGIPSHDCFGRVFALINPEAFAACFRQWSAAVATLLPDEIIAVDGKTLRRSHNRSQGLAALHLVSAWATANRVVLGQVATAAKSNEITAIPRLLEVESRREVAGKVTIETRYFIGSIGTSASRFAQAVRGHWGVENGLHWNLDISFREDECRVRDPVARENLAVLRHIALSRLKNDDTKLGLQNKRLKAACNEDYLAKLLFESPKRKDDAGASASANISGA